MRRSQKIRAMKMRYIAMFLLLVPFGQLGAQGMKEDLYRYYVANDWDSWEKLIAGGQWNTLPASDQYEFAMAHYGFIAWCLGHDQKVRAKPYLEKAELMTDDLLKRSPGDARFLALRGALFGFRLLYEPHKIMSIGPKSLKNINEAIEKDPDCAPAWIELGNMDWSTPGFLGGSKLEALAEYEKAIKLMEKNPEFIRHSWYYLNVNMILANWYQTRGRTFASHEVYRKVLQIEPEFSRAKQELAK